MPEPRGASQRVQRRHDRKPYIAIVTGETVLRDIPNDENARLADALAQLGACSAVVRWDNPEVDWERFSCCIIRTAFDWHRKRREFLHWARTTAERTTIVNSVDVLERGSDKRYLTELQEAGMATIPTVYIQGDSQAALRQIVSEQGWEDIIIKPAVGIGSVGVKRVRHNQMDEGERYLRALSNVGSAVVQEYQPSIEVEGELSVVFVSPALAHAVRRVPRKGEFRAHYTLGCREFASKCDDEDKSACLVAIRNFGPGALCGRIDLIRDRTGRNLVSEVEVVAPLLYLRHDSATCSRLATALLLRTEGK